MRAHRGDLLAPFGLRQHRAADAGVAQQPQVVGERRRFGIVDAHDDAVQIRRGGRPVGDGIARIGLGVGGDGVLEVEHDRDPPPLASALAKRSGRLPGTNR